MKTYRSSAKSVAFGLGISAFGGLFLAFESPASVASIGLFFAVFGVALLCFGVYNLCKGVDFLVSERVKELSDPDSKS